MKSILNSNFDYNNGLKWVPGQYPPWTISPWTISLRQYPPLGLGFRVRVGGYCRGGYCPGRYCPGGILSEGILSGGLYCLGVYCPGGYCPGGYCPRTGWKSIVFRFSRSTKPRLTKLNLSWLESSLPLVKNFPVLFRLTLEMVWRNWPTYWMTCKVSLLTCISTKTRVSFFFM